MERKLILNPINEIVRLLSHIKCVNLLKYADDDEISLVFASKDELFNRLGKVPINQLNKMQFYNSQNIDTTNIVIDYFSSRKRINDEEKDTCTNYSQTND